MQSYYYKTFDEIMDEEKAKTTSSSSSSMESRTSSIDIKGYRKRIEEENDSQGEEVDARDVDDFDRWIKKYSLSRKSKVSSDPTFLVGKEQPSSAAATISSLTQLLQSTTQEEWESKANKRRIKKRSSRL